MVIFLLSIVVTFVCCISELFFFGLDIVNIKANVVEVDCVVVPEILNDSNSVLSVIAFSVFRVHWLPVIDKAPTLQFPQ